MGTLMRRPYLICLNLQQDIAAGRERSEVAGALLWRMRSALQWARKHSIGIAHAHSIEGYLAAPPIQGFEAHANEIVLTKLSLSLFASDEWRRSMACDSDRVLLMGFSRRCDLAATALHGTARGIQVVILRDAIGLEPGTAGPAAGALCQLLSPAVGSIDAGDLWERRELTAAMNLGGADG